MRAKGDCLRRFAEKTLFLYQTRSQRGPERSNVISAQYLGYWSSVLFLSGEGSIYDEA